LLGRLRARRAPERRTSRASRPTLTDELDGRSWADADAFGDGAGLPREPRHVRAVPMDAEQKILAATDLFNESEHRRTMAGLARSLGPPSVAVLPSSTSASQVRLIFSWELCWYRYEVELSDDPPSVRSAGQGTELSELGPEELQPTASVDGDGTLSPVGVE
jgi:hypothetical protein